MHCEACDKELTNFEATRKHAETGHFIDLCNECFSPIADVVPVIERVDLFTMEDISEDDS